MDRDQLIEKIKSLGLECRIEGEYIRAVAPEGNGYCRISVEGDDLFYIRKDGVCLTVDGFDLITILEQMSPRRPLSPRYVVVADEKEIGDGIGRGTIVGEFDTDEALEDFLKNSEWRNFTVYGPKDFKYVSVSQ